MKRLIGTLIMGVLCANAATAQNETDALRYSYLNLGGTARYNAMGGAFGALGGDLATTAANPAGIAVYRKSEFGATLGFTTTNTDATYNGTTASQGEPNLNFGNVGLVAAYDLDNSYGWRNFQFGIAYNRLNNFSSHTVIRGDDDDSSMLDVFTDQASGVSPDGIYNALPFTSGLAYDAFLIDPIDTIGTGYTSQIFGGTSQSKSITESGRMGETAILFGGNWDDRLYIGGGIAFPSVSYQRSSQYAETPLADSLVNVSSWEYTETLSTRGVGFNARFGLIFSPAPFVRMGASIQSPTWFSLNDSWNSSVRSFFNPGTGYDADYLSSSPDGRFDYRLTTPARATGSLAFIISKFGLISADYEWIDYGSAKLRPDNSSGVAYSFTDENNQISNQLVSTANLRVGAEWRLQPFSLRAGYQMIGDPYRADATVSDGMRTVYSLGFGYRESDWFLDLAYQLHNWGEDHYVYDPALVEAALLDKSFSRVSLTLGFRY